MKKFVIGFFILVGLLFVGNRTLSAIESATPPTLVKSTSVLNVPDVLSVVTVDGPAVIKMTNLAYRHPEQVQVSLTVTAAGTYELRDRCRQIRLPHTWIVYVNNVRIASSSLKCE